MKETLQYLKDRAFDSVDCLGSIVIMPVIHSSLCKRKNSEMKTRMKYSRLRVVYLWLQTLPQRALTWQMKSVKQLQVKTQNSFITYSNMLVGASVYYNTLRRYGYKSIQHCTCTSAMVYTSVRKHHWWEAFCLCAKVYFFCQWEMSVLELKATRYFTLKVI